MVTEISSARRRLVMESVMLVARAPVEDGGIRAFRGYVRSFSFRFVRRRGRTEDDGDAHARRVLLVLVREHLLQEPDVLLGGVQVGVGQTVGDHHDAVVSKRERTRGPSAVAIRRGVEVHRGAILALGVGGRARVQALVRPLVLLLKLAHAPVVRRVLLIVLGLVVLDHGGARAAKCEDDATSVRPIGRNFSDNDNGDATGVVCHENGYGTATAPRPIGARAAGI